MAVAANRSEQSVHPSILLIRGDMLLSDPVRLVMGHRGNLNAQLSTVHGQTRGMRQSESWIIISLFDIKRPNSHIYILKTRLIPR